MNANDSTKIIGSTSRSLAFSVSEFTINVVPISAVVGCGVKVDTKLAADISKK